MADVLSLIREVMTLTSTVGGLKSDVVNLIGKVENHTERIVRLENREELLAERMARTAVQAVSEMNMRMVDRLHAIENKVCAIENKLGMPPPQAPKEFPK